VNPPKADAEGLFKTRDGNTVTAFVKNERLFSELLSPIEDESCSCVFCVEALLVVKAREGPTTAKRNATIRALIAIMIVLYDSSVKEK
jgi:hypothetical protein